MVQELRKALKRAEKLSKERQKSIAEIVLDEISWDQSFQASQHQLDSMALEAHQEYKSKKTKPLKLG